MVENTEKFTSSQVKETLFRCIKEFYKEEQSLLKDDLCERALVFRLGCRMYSKFHGCSVYSEYNRAHAEDNVSYKDIPGKIHTYPDLIVVSDSEKGSNANKLMIEVKKEKNNDLSSDIEKLKWFSDQSYKYRYLCACHLFLSVDYFLVCSYENGNVKDIFQFTLRDNQWIYNHVIPASDFNYSSLKDLHIAINSARNANE